MEHVSMISIALPSHSAPHQNNRSLFGDRGSPLDLRGFLSPLTVVYSKGLANLTTGFELA